MGSKEEKYRNTIRSIDGSSAFRIRNENFNLNDKLTYHEAGTSDYTRTFRSQKFMLRVNKYFIIGAT